MTSPSGVLEIDALVDSAYLRPMQVGTGLTLGTGFALGTPTLVTYSFATPSSTQASQGYAAFSDFDKSAARLALDLYSQICGLKFVEDTTSPAAADIRFMWDNNFATHYGNYSGITYTSIQSDNYLSSNVYFNAATVKSSVTVWNGLQPGEAGFSTFLHEIGHALGLKHPGNYGNSSDAGPYLPAAEDNESYTVMSYNPSVSPGPWGRYSYADKPMSLDVGAMQFLYGQAGTSITVYATNLEWSSSLNGFTGTAANEQANLANIEIGHQWPGSFSAQSDGAIHYHYARHTIDGGAGIDVLKVDAPASAGKLSCLSEKTYELQVGLPFTPSSNPNGYRWVTDFDETLIGVERVRYSDKSIALDISGNPNACFDTAGTADAGQVYRLYQAAFDRVPDKLGLAYWIGQADLRVSLVSIASGFTGSVEFKNTYGNLTDHQFVEQIYRNVLHRTGDPLGLSYWYGQLDAHTMSREQVLVGFSDSSENQVALIGTIQNGIDYTA